MAFLRNKIDVLCHLYSLIQGSLPFKSDVFQKELPECFPSGTYSGRPFCTLLKSFISIEFPVL
jgi:hypothetical protein